jgi:uncharacterized protein YciI
MQFFVHGVDRDGVDERLDELSEAHWEYMDRFAGTLVARGPTLSPDGMTHTGSVHAVEVADGEAARRFAFEEPFWRAGLYASVAVNRFYNAVNQTMWERPPASADAPSSLVLATWPPSPGSSGRLDEHWSLVTQWTDLERLVIGGFLLGDEGREVQGLVLAVDLAQQPAAYLAAQLLVPGSAAVSVQRWHRGGRPELSA